MHQRYIVDVVILDPSSGEDEGPAVVCSFAVFGPNLETAMASATTAIAPHVAHMDYEFAILRVGVWCDDHREYHSVSELLGPQPHDAVEPSAMEGTN